MLSRTRKKFIGDKGNGIWLYRWVGSWYCFKHLKGEGYNRILNNVAFSIRLGFCLVDFFFLFAIIIGLL